MGMKNGRTDETADLELQLARMTGEGPAKKFQEDPLPPIWETKNTLPERVRVQVVGLLQDRLAESLDLKIRAKDAHWNVKGPNFIALHKLFDEIAEEADDFSDLIAERIMQLGGTAEGTLHAAIKKSGLPAHPVTLRTEFDHVLAVSQALAAFGE